MNKYIEKCLDVKFLCYKDFLISLIKLIICILFLIIVNLSLFFIVISFLNYFLVIFKNGSFILLNIACSIFLVSLYYQINKIVNYLYPEDSNLVFLVHSLYIVAIKPSILLIILHFLKINVPIWLKIIISFLVLIKFFALTAFDYTKYKNLNKIKNFALKISPLGFVLGMSLFAIKSFSTMVFFLNKIFFF